MFKYFNSFVLRWRPGNPFSGTGSEAATRDAWERESVLSTREWAVQPEIFMTSSLLKAPRRQRKHTEKYIINQRGIETDGEGGKPPPPTLWIRNSPTGISPVEILRSAESFDADKTMVKTVLQRIQSMYVVTGSWHQPHIGWYNMQQCTKKGMEKKRPFKPALVWFVTT